MRKQVLLTLVLAGAFAAVASATVGTSVNPVVAGWTDADLNGIIGSQELDPLAGGWIDTNGNGRIDFSDWIKVTLHYDGLNNAMLSWDLIVAADGMGLLDGSTAVPTGWNDPSFTFPPVQVGPNAWEVGAANFGGIPAGPIYDEFWIHCEGKGMVVVEVLPGYQWGGSLEIDGLTPYRGDFGVISIWQVPEPMTMVLLGLGGLGLIRRRRA